MSLNDSLHYFLHQVYQTVVLLALICLSFVLFLMRTYSFHPISSSSRRQSKISNNNNNDNNCELLQFEEEEEEEEEPTPAIETRKKRILAEVTVDGFGELSMTSEIEPAKTSTTTSDPVYF